MERLKNSHEVKWSVKCRCSLHTTGQCPCTRWEIKGCRREGCGPRDRTITARESGQHSLISFSDQPLIPTTLSEVRSPNSRFVTSHEAPKRCVSFPLKSLHFRLSKHHLFTELERNEHQLWSNELLLSGCTFSFWNRNEQELAILSPH